MPIDVIVVPYALGREGVGTGAGPLALRDALAADPRLAPGRFVYPKLSRPFEHEIGASFDLARQVAAAVSAARSRGALPVVLAGNCVMQQAVLAGLGSDERLALAWLDCHADFNTPETTVSGFFDGMALAMIAGDCWAGLCASVPGFRPLGPDRVVLAGVRDVDEVEQQRLEAANLRVLDPPSAVELATTLPEGAPISLHVDLDVLDPPATRANAWTTPGGLDTEALVDVVRTTASQHEIAALTLASYDPVCDHAGNVLEAALAVLRLVVAARRWSGERT